MTPATNTPLTNALKACANCGKLHLRQKWVCECAGRGTVWREPTPEELAEHQRVNDNMNRLIEELLK